MTWLIFCFISIAFTVVYGLISKKILSSQADYHPIAYASTLFLATASYALRFYILSGVQQTDFFSAVSPQVLPILILNILCYALAPSIYYRVLKKIPVSEITILYSLVGIYALIFGIIIGVETLIVARLIGGLLIIAATVILNFRGKQFKFDQNVWLMVLATCLYGIGALTDNYIIGGNHLSPLFLQTVSYGLPAILILLFNKSSLKHLKKIYKKKVLPLFFFNGAFSFVSFLSIYKAYEYGGDTSQVNLVLSTATIIMVLCAAVFLGERKNFVLKIAASILAATGVYLLQ